MKCDGAYCSYAKVPNLDLHICSQKEVQGFNVAVQDALAVHVLQTKRSLQAANLAVVYTYCAHHEPLEHGKVNRTA